MEKVLVTGAGGFIGSHLCEYLVSQGYAVRAFVHYNANNHRGWLEASPVAKQMEIVSGDIRDYDSVHQAAEGVSGIFHLAALIGIPYSYRSPLAYVKTNVEGTYNILEATRRLNLKRVMLTSTSEVYGTARQVPISETHVLQPQSPYSASKIGADQLGLSYRMSFGTPVVIARPFNTYGPRQSARAVLPTIASQLLARQPEIRLGSLTPTRDFTYVGDTVRGMLEVYKTDAFLGRVINIGSGTEISVGDAARLLCRIVGFEARLAQEELRVRPENSEVERLVCDASELKRHTSWKPEVAHEVGFRKMVDWLSTHIALYKPQEYNV